MKVLMISSDRKIFEEGSAVRARLLEYGRLVEELHVIVFAKQSARLLDKKILPNIFIYSTNSFSKFLHILYAIFCVLRLKRQGVSVDVVTTQDPFEAGLAGYIITRFFNARLHVQIHTDFMSPHFARESLLNRARVILAKFLIPQANAIRVVSNRIENSLSKVKGQRSKVAVLPILIEPYKETMFVDMKKKFPQFDKIVLVVSRLSREKNIDSVIEAMGAVVQKYPTAGLIIVGDGPERDSLVLKTKNNNLEDNVVFEGWQNNLDSYYKSADVFVLASYYEGYGMVVVEALTLGCPVIMTDVGCAGDIVRDGENGLIVPVGDTPSLSNAIEKVLSGEIKLITKTPKLSTKEEYFIAYKKSLESALV